MQATYLLSFVLLTLATLRLPPAFSLGFTVIDITFVLAFLGMTTGNTSIRQDLGGKALPLGNPVVR
ncbi:hypothetical protein [Pseudonocardia asaccharolytica]|uniref:Uncharacterized protein n=1 Tax=Pseudonocardia asaccharolytica DSM 44247 = NBRC 16224 TaxID=1123024 RepID=A0A511CVB4_9PSEU|nr:hypothetical protein [Pseudonocardia asaccharolytica]GEL16193.1 hypothetical protein PA7_00300 [Pseudonocardia asaccharolytica DSM 44247 = NBRC 16224]